jgi:hypothetical protein
MSSDGRLLNSLEATSPDGIHLLHMEEGTRTLDSEGNIVTLVEIRYAAEVPQLSRHTLLLGRVYDFQPTGSTFSKQIILSLAYDIDLLPEYVTSVALAYHSTELGWVELESESGVVAEVGRVTAPVEHFTIFAVLATAEPAPSEPIVPPSEPIVPFWWPIILFLLALIVLIWWLLRKYVIKIAVFLMTLR